MTVTILMAAYNAGGFIGEAVQSALDQDVPDKEILVVNDGSTDRTLEVLKSFEGSIRVLNEPHGGLARALNAGLSAARGSHFLRLDADDALVPGALARLTAEVAGGNGVGCVYSDRWEIHSDGRRERIALSPFNLFKTVACGILFHTETARFVGGYSDLLFEEYDFLLRYFRKNPSKVHVPEPLYLYRRHADSLTATAGYWRKGWRQLLQKWGKEELDRWKGADALPAQ